MFYKARKYLFSAAYNIVCQTPQADKNEGYSAVETAHLMKRHKQSAASGGLVYVTLHNRYNHIIVLGI